MLERLGASRMGLTGCSDVALARNQLMTAALQRAEPERTVFLLVDDDITFTQAQGELICADALETEYPVSGVYVVSPTSLAHTPLEANRWLCGMGFMAIRRDLLQAYADRIGSVQTALSGEIWPFCQSRERDGRWVSEDYWFSHEMGGVELIKIAVSHLKLVPLAPDERTVDMLSNPEAALAAAKEQEAAKAAE